MNLSVRATRYLGQMERVDVTPIQRVRELMASRGGVNDAWLEYHGQFGGYVESIYKERCVYGLAFPSPQWLMPETLEIEESEEDGRMIICADVHPSYQYLLAEDGRFVSTGIGGTRENFGIKVEQDALIAEVWSQGFRPCPAQPDDAVSMNRDLRLIPEASDRFSQFLRGDSVLLLRTANGSREWRASP